MRSRSREVAARPESHTAPVARAAFALDDGEREQLAAACQRALARARSSGRPTLATFALALPDGTDPAALVCASRRPDEPWFLLEQPDRARRSLACTGEVTELSAAGPERFAELARRWRALVADAVQETAAPRLAGCGGPVAVGGFSFACDGGHSPHWRGFAPGSLSVPEVAVVRDMHEGRERIVMTLAALAAPDDTAGELLAALSRRVEGLREAPLPLLDPAPAGRFEVLSAMPPEHHEQAVARAVELIAAGRMQKIVLAREVQVHAPRAHDAPAVFGVLREQFSSCFVFCVGRGSSAFIAASPELLVRREGQRVSTIALAASCRRSADPAVDAHLGEQMLRDPSYREEHAIVARGIERTLRPHAVWVTSAPEPELVRVANIQHLATPIRAQLAEPIDAIEMAGLMHPTPAVGGEPRDAATELIPALEGLDRGWYAGTVGWTDAAGDGEFCVSLRCALLDGPLARCYAGGGIVRGSDPAAELAETEVKLAALLPLLSG